MGEEWPLEKSWNFGVGRIWGPVQAAPGQVTGSFARLTLLVLQC